MIQTSSKRNFTVRELTLAAVVAAVYFVLCYFGNIFQLTFGPVQVRLGEALTVLPFLFPATAPGVALGCLLTNVLSPYGPIDMIVGTLAPGRPAPHRDERPAAAPHVGLCGGGRRQQRVLGLLLVQHVDLCGGRGHRLLCAGYCAAEGPVQGQVLPSHDPRRTSGTPVNRGRSSARTSWRFSL